MLVTGVELSYLMSLSVLRNLSPNKLRMVGIDWWGYKNEIQKTIKTMTLKNLEDNNAFNSHYIMID